MPAGRLLRLWTDPDRGESPGAVLGLPAAGVELVDRELDGDYRTAIRVSSGAEWFAAVRLPPGARLRFGAAAESPAGEPLRVEGELLLEVSAVRLPRAAWRALEHPSSTLESGTEDASSRDAAGRLRALWAELGATAETATRPLPLGPNLAPLWREIELDLASLGSGPVLLRFSAQWSRSPEGQPPGCLILWGTPYIQAAPPRVTPNVLVLVVDCLRADHCGVYGLPEDTTGNFDLLARRGVTFHQVWAPSSWTRPSVASLLTGRYPSRHGTMSRTDKLSAHIPTLQSRFRAAGYLTAMITDNAYIGRSYGFRRGWDRFIEAWHVQPRYERAEQEAQTPLEPFVGMVERVLDAAAPAPFLLYVHNVYPHAPYIAPWPDEARYLTGDSWPEWRFPVDREASPEHVRGTGELFRAEVRHADRFTGRVLHALARRGLLENTLVVLTADHGEELFEHQDWQHGKRMFEESIAIPLIIAGPGIPDDGRVIDGRAELIDLPATLLALAGAEPLAGDGMSLLPRLSRKWRPSSDPAASELHLQDFYEFALAVGDRKAIYNPLEPWKGVRLYDLSTDPGEQNPTVLPREAPQPAIVPELVARAEALLPRWRVSFPGGTGAGWRGVITVRDGAIFIDRLSGDLPPSAVRRDSDGGRIVFRARDLASPAALTFHTIPTSATLAWELLVNGTADPTRWTLGPGDEPLSEMPWYWSGGSTAPDPRLILSGPPPPPPASAGDRARIVRIEYHTTTETVSPPELEPQEYEFLKRLGYFN